MNKSSNNSNPLFQIIKNPIKLAFTLSFAYWIYLVFTSSMVIRWDAEVYEKLASTIYRDGWVSFFKFKPTNVALYPFIISISMRIADFLGITYFPIQTFVQVLFLFTSQVLLYKILKTLGVGRNIIATTLLYFGFSPAIVNSAYSLYCEIITYPLVLGIIFMSIMAWKKIHTANYAQNILQGIFLAVIFIVISLVRQVNEYILIIYLFTIALFSLRYLFTQHWKILFNSALLITTVFGVYHLALNPYKAMNFKYNGYKSLTMVGSESFYANAAGRSQPLTMNNILTFLAHVPGDGVCLKLFGEEKCSFWWDQNIHGLGLAKTKELKNQGIPNHEIDSNLRALALKRIFSNPLQYSFLTAAEGLKMVFWESTQIGFVTYPNWLDQFFRWAPFKDGLRFTVFLITFLTLALSFYYTFKYRNNLYIQNSQESVVSLVYVFCLVIIMGNIVLHAPFRIATRYALPITPLYLILIALNTQHFCKKK